MDLIRASITRPIAVIAAVLMVVMFGAVGLTTIPIQLIPDVRQPVINITTNWGGAAPAEVEREIINRQEEVLKGLEGVEKMTSSSTRGEGEITLEFLPDQNMDRALLLVANRLDRVTSYPEEADEPTLSTSGSEDQPIAWFVLRRLDKQPWPMNEYGDFAEDVIQDRLERVPGVSRINVFGGTEQELRVIVDPELLAAYRLTVPQVVDALRAANISISAGNVDEGKRRYTVRVEGQFATPDEVRAVVIRSDSEANGNGTGAEAPGGVARVLLGDIATVDFAFKDERARIRFLGERSLALNAIRETGANVIETMEGVREAVAQLNDGVLADEGLYLRQVYDETIYIESAIDLVIQNIWIGGLLAAGILILFLRAFGPTLVISLGIPVSVIGAFVGMALMGRSLNVISLAGIAFAVGMVVDAAIVVLENIYRLRERGYSRVQAAWHGARQVWGAILVSALTTVMVFIPILTLNLEVGQLFRDIAVAISVSVMLSLVVAVTVIPALSRRLLGRVDRKVIAEGPKGTAKSRSGPKIPIVDDIAKLVHRAFVGLAKLSVAKKSFAALLVAVVVGSTGTATYMLMPKLEYLPEGNRNFIFGIILPPPGYNLDTTSSIGQGIEQAVSNLWSINSGEERDPGGPPKIENFFFVSLNEQAFVGATAVEDQAAAELIPVMTGPVFREPGTFGFISQPSLFGRTIGGGRAVDLNITGENLESILQTAQMVAGRVGGVLPRSEGNQLRPIPGLELGAPEVRVLPDPVRLADNGVTVRTFGETVDAFNDGLRVDEITVGAKRIDLTLRGVEDHITRTQGIDTLPVVTESGRILPVSSLGTVQITAGPTEIQHLERVRTVTLQIRPAAQIPLESAMEILETQVIAPMEAEGLPPGVSLSLSGTADKLTQTWNVIVFDLLLALVIVYLVMAVLFESFAYPLIILVTVPTASAGAVLGLALLNLYKFQPLDMLTMLGFIILVGIVVNNAILLVHQTLHHIRHEAMEAGQAIVEATSNRIRPIFMSTLTSLFGMMPLVLVPGAGSELYRGLGAVILGGLALSAVLTLIIIPPLLSLFSSALMARRGRNLGLGLGRRGKKAKPKAAEPDPTPPAGPAATPAPAAE